MTRDGLIEVNETKETAERVSHREREADFSRPKEQPAPDMPQKKRQGLKPAAQEQPEPQAAKETAAQNAAELPPVFPDASPLPLAPELPHRQDTATAERVMERIDAAQTRKASKKAAQKAQRDATVKEKSSRLQFTEEELNTPELETYIRKSDKAADRLDAATLTAFCAALMLMGGFSVTAFAQTPEQPAADATNDSGVIYEEPEETAPLTPEGNATLVDDFGGNKQLITVTTKAGNYFYILIDRDDEGENTVHFLNQVDDADLFALLEDGESSEAQTPAVCTCTEKCETGKINTSCPVCSTNMTACSGKEAEPEPEEPTEQPQEKSNTGGLVLFLVVALLGGGGAFYYFKFMKPKQSVKGGTDLEDFDFEDYDEDEPEPDDADGDASEDETEDEDA